MIIEIDDKKYAIHLAEIADKLKKDYQTFDFVFSVNGKDYNLKKGSVQRVALKTALTPFLVPLVQGIYKKLSLPLANPEKRQDLLDYCILALINLLKLKIDGIHLYGNSQTDTDDITHIIGLSTVERRDADN